MCLLNIKRSAPSPPSITTARTDPWKAGALETFRRMGVGGVTAEVEWGQTQLPECPKPSCKTPFQRTPTHTPKTGEVRPQVGLSTTSSPTLKYSSKAAPTGKPTEGRPQTGGKDPEHGVPEYLLSSASLDSLNSFLLPQAFVAWTGIYLLAM